MTAIMVLAFMPVNLQAVNEKGKTMVVTEKAVVSPEETALLARMDEIKAMDVSTLSSVQKKELRHEMRAIKDALNTMSGEIIYISAGGLILVIVLLIILL